MKTTGAIVEGSIHDATSIEIGNEKATVKCASFGAFYLA
jgi:hypothetical protein